MKALTARMIVLLAVLVVGWPLGTAAAAPDDLWQGVREGRYLVLLRHAIAPGTGDPANFDVDDCSTQRNLSEGGREQARRIGERLRANGVERARLYSSQWCRCLDTAELLNLGPVTELPALNSFFGRYERREPQMRELRRWLAEQPQDETTVLVTHQVVITALSGVFPASGELVITAWPEGGEVEVVGTVETR